MAPTRNIALALALLTGLAATPAAAAAGADRPNLVVVMTDDQTVEELSAMPRTRRLVAAKGVRFERSYVSYPVCCPSRATFLTGRYAHNHGVMGLYPPTGGYGRFDKHAALPVWLRRAGYFTAHLGKFLNGYGDQEPADVPPGWSDWRATVDYSTYSMWGYTLNENGRLRTYGRPFREDPRLYQTDVLARKAQSIVESRAGRGPFFISLNLLAPHHEGRGIQRRTGQIVRPAPRHRHAAVALPARGAGFNERDLSDKPRFIQRRGRRLGRAALRRIQRVAVQRRRALLAVDDAVARVIGTLRRTGELERTYVIFTSDNGYLQGEHGIGSGKMLPYDPSTAVPLLIRGPGLPAGAVSGELVANVDLAPTLLELAGASPGAPVDGRSLMPFARRPGLRSRRAILHETGGSRWIGRPGQDEVGGRGLRRVLTYRAVRLPGWLYVRYRGGARELYDLRRDPDQLQSVHADPRYRRTRRVLGRELRRLVRCSGEECRRPAPRVPGKSTKDPLQPGRAGSTLAS
jgi:N-acetylglucosamine-6-sulfatase